MAEAGRKTTSIKHDLKTCEGGWVELRQLSYDEMLERTDGAMHVTQRMGIKNEAATVRFANRWTNLFTFPRCIVDHNLTFDGKPIDFSKPAVAFEQLDPKIGREIEQLIDELNQEDQAEEDFTTLPSSASSEESSSPSSTTGES